MSTTPILVFDFHRYIFTPTWIWDREHYSSFAATIYFIQQNAILNEACSKLVFKTDRNPDTHIPKLFDRCKITQMAILSKKVFHFMDFLDGSRFVMFPNAMYHFWKVVNFILTIFHLNTTELHAQAKLGRIIHRCLT